MKITLDSLEAFDPTAPYTRSRERKFCCPLPECAGKPVDAAHRKFYLNTQTTAYYCHRCGGKGRLWVPAEQYRPRVSNWSASTVAHRPTQQDQDRLDAEYRARLDDLTRIADDYRRWGDDDLAATITQAVAAHEFVVIGTEDHGGMA